MTCICVSVATGPSSKIQNLVIAPPIKKDELNNDFIHWQSFNHDASNSHVPDINFLEFLVQALSITSYHGW